MCYLRKISTNRLVFDKINHLGILLLFIFSFLMLVSPVIHELYAKPQNTPSIQQSFPVEDIRDIRGPIPIPYSWLWIFYTLGGLIIGGLLISGYLYWEKHPRTIPKLPHQIALEQLQQAFDLMTPDQAREFSIAVSNAVRHYIEDRFRVRAAHHTTEEFLHDLVTNSASPLANYSASLEEFLKHCDLAKFARWALSIPEMQSMHQSARKFVEETQPKSLSINKNI